MSKKRCAAGKVIGLVGGLERGAVEEDCKRQSTQGLLGQMGSVLLFSLGVALRTEPPALWLVEDLWKFVGKQRINPL